MAYDDEDEDDYYEVPEVEPDVEPDVEPPAPAPAPEPEDELPEPPETPLPRDQYAAAATGTKSDASLEDDFEIYRDPTPAPAARGAPAAPAAPAPAAKAAAPEPEDDFEIHPYETSVAEQAEVAARGTGSSFLHGVGSAIKSGSIVNPNPYDAAPRPEPPAPAPQTPEEAEAAGPAFSTPRMARKERLSAERQQAVNREAVQANIDEAKKTPFEQRPLARAGSTVQEWGKAIEPTPQQKESYPITAKTGEVIGGAGAAVTAGAVGTLAGGPTVGLIAAGGVMAAQSAGDTYDRAVAAINQRIAAAQKAGDVTTAKRLLDTRDDTAAKAAGFSAVVNGAMGVIPIGMVLRPIKDIAPGAMGRIWAMADHAFKGAPVFAGVGEAQKYLGEQMAKSFDPKAKYEFNYQDVIASLLGGGVLSAGGAAVQRRPPKAPELPPPPEAPIQGPEQGRLPFGPSASDAPLPYSARPPDPMTPKDWARHADIAERWDTTTPKERTEYAALEAKIEAARAKPEPAQIGGGEAQLELPVPEPMPPKRPGGTTQPELALEPPPTGTPPTAEGQLGFTLEAPRGGGIPRTFYENGKWVTETASRPAMPSTGGVAKEATPPPRTTPPPPPPPMPPGAPAAPGSTAAAVGAMEQAAKGLPQGAPAAPGEPTSVGEKPHTAVEGKNVIGAGPQEAAGINVLQPGEVDPTFKHAAAYPAGPQTTFEPPRPPDGSLPGGKGEPLPPGQSLVPRPAEGTQGKTETPAPVGHTRMYQGERQPSNAFTTDRKIAEQYGPVSYVDVHNKQGLPFFSPSNEAGVFTTRNNIYRTRSRPIEEILTEPVGGPVPPAAPEMPPAPPAPPVKPGAQPSSPELDFKINEAIKPPAPPAPPAAPPAPKPAPPAPKPKKPPVKVGDQVALVYGQTSTLAHGTVVSQSTFSQAIDKHGTRKGLLGPLTSFIQRGVTKTIGNMPVHVVSGKDFAKAGEGKTIAFYDPNTNHIVVNGAHLGNKKTMQHAILHEGVHAVTYWSAQHIAEVKTAIDTIRADVQAKHLAQQAAAGKTGISPELRNGLKDQHEFLADTFSKPEFQDFLKRHNLSPDAAKELQAYFGKYTPAKSAWDGIVQTVRNILKLPPSKLNALEAAMRVTEQAMALNRPVMEVKVGKGVQTDYSQPTKLNERHDTPELQKIRLGQLLRDKAASKKAGEDVDGPGYAHNNALIRDLRSKLKEAPEAVQKATAPGKGTVIARDKFGNEIKFTKETVHAAAARARAAGYKHIFNEDGTPYEAPKATPGASAAPVAQPPGGGTGKPPTGAQTGAQTAAKGAQTSAKGAQTAQPGGAPAKSTLVPASKSDLATGFGASLRRMFVPMRSESAQVAAGALRKAAGPLARVREQTATRFTNELHRIANNMDRPAFEKFVDSYETGKVASLPKDQQSLAGVLKKNYDDFWNEIKKLPGTEKMEAISDYLTHMYKNDKGQADRFAKEFYSASGGSLKERTHPTFTDARAAGLEALSNNPIEHFIRYSEGISHHLAQRQMMADLTAQNRIGYFGPKTVGASGAPEPLVLRAPPDGYSELKMPWAEKMGRKAYAPRDIAETLNQFYDAGLRRGQAKDIYEYALMTKNMWTAVELGLSAYHATTMGVESMASGMARALQLAASGEYRKATAQLFKSPVEPVTAYLYGRKGRQLYRGDDTKATPLQKRIMDLLTQANVQPGNLRITGEYDMSRLGNFWDSYKRGSLPHEFNAQLKSISDSYGLKLPAVLLENVRRAMQTISKPLFEHYIPELKLGTMMKDMEAWLHVNPTATDAQALNYARKVADSIDNRMGEMNYDNLFMNKAAKDLGMLSLRSFGFTVGGPVREIGAGTGRLVGTAAQGKNPLKHFDLRSEKADPRTAYAMAFLPAIAMISAAYQYFRTGKPPEDWRDLVTPKTGGKIKSMGKESDERILVPGYHKDFLGYFVNPEGVPGELKAKLAAPWTTLAEQFTGKDWRDKPYVPPRATTLEWLQAHGKQLGSHMVPIGPKQLAEGKKEGSKLTLGEQMLGVRTPGAYMLNPKSLEEFHTKQRQKDWAADEKRENRKRIERGLEPLPRRSLPAAP